MSMTKEDRLVEYFKRLADAPAQGTTSAAQALLARVLNELEDEMTDIPNDPTQWATDGRMYPILEDNWEELDSGGWLGRSRGHRTLVCANGAIEITRKSDGKVEFSKLGADGKGVDS